MLVYRVEHADTGLGPYNYEYNYIIGHDLDIDLLGITTEQYQHALDSYNLGCEHSVTHLSITEELESVGLKFNENLSCGFSSIAACKAWFRSDKHFFDKHEYRLCCYRVNLKYVKKHPVQLAFNKAKAELVYSKPIKDVLWN